MTDPTGYRALLADYLPPINDPVAYEKWRQRRAAENTAKLAANPMPVDLVPVALVPVQVFGATCDCHDHLEGTEEGVKCRGWGYGLSDAVEAWSDCNRAEGHIYRVDDTDPDHRQPGETVRIFVSKADLPWFEKRFGEQQHEEGS